MSAIASLRSAPACATHRAQFERDGVDVSMGFGAAINQAVDCDACARTLIDFMGPVRERIAALEAVAEAARRCCDVQHLEWQEHPRALAAALAALEEKETP